MDDPEDENFDSFFSDAPWLEFQCDTEDCPPPLFELPPPPRPPWLDPDDSCDDSSEYESCENIVIIDSQVQLETTFHNLIIIAVCSAVLVILLVFLVACIWRWENIELLVNILSKLQWTTQNSDDNYKQTLLSVNQKFNISNKQL